MNKNKKIEGLLYFHGGKNACVSNDPYSQQETYYQIPAVILNRFHLKEGARIKAEVAGHRITRVLEVNGKSPDLNSGNRRFEMLTAINPLEKFDLGGARDIDLRILDLVAPIAKGARTLIISPPRAGKTMLLEKLALFFAVEKKLRTILILIDERPEEITHFKQVTGLPVFSSSLDSSFESHTKLSGLLMKNIKQEIEAQNDVVVLIDSLTRLGRAHNLDDRRSGSRTLSGGLGARALEIPRKLFGMARNIEGGGSCTIIATILHNTGSRMDEHIFQEFKGTGNSEIMLSRQLAEKRLFPAVNIKESGTRREELMRPESDLNKLNIWRRHLLALEPDLAWQKLHAALMKYPDNNSLFKEL